MELEKKYKDNLDKWIGITNEILDEMKEDKVEDGSMIKLSYAFSHSKKKPIKKLSKALKDELDYKVDIDFLPEDGEEPALYVLYGETKAIESYIKGLTSLLTQMIELGAKYKCKFEYWEARLVSDDDNLSFSVGSFDNRDDLAKEEFPLLLKLQVDEDIKPIERGDKYQKPLERGDKYQKPLERGDKYQKPLEDLLDKKNLGIIIRSGSVFNIKDKLEIENFEIIFRIANEKKAIKKITKLLLNITTKDKFRFDMIEKDIVI